MPYSGASDKDLPDYVKDKPIEKRKQWVSAFNSAFADCEAEDKEDCEGYAFRVANAAVKESCMLAEAATIKAQVQGLLRAADKLLRLKDLPTKVAREIEDLRSVLKSTKWTDLEKVKETAMTLKAKIEETEEQQAELEEHDDGVYVPYGVTSFNSLDAVQVAAVTAQYQFTLLEQFRQMAWNILHNEDVEDKSGELQSLTGEFIDRLQLISAETNGLSSAAGVGGGQTQNGIATNEVSESGSAALDDAQGSLLIEGAFTDIALLESDESAPLELEMVVIEPGFGNRRDNHYYSETMLKTNSHVFDGLKMYATDHRPSEKSVRTEVSEVLECPVRFSESGAPIARVGVHDPYFAKVVRNRAELGTLESLHCSILADGEAVPDEIEGQECKRVTKITEAYAVDWVTQAGAGGHALNIIMEAEQMAKELTEEEKALVEKEAQAAVAKELAAVSTPIKIKEEGTDEDPPEAPPEETPLEETLALSLAEKTARLGQTALPIAEVMQLVLAEYQDAEALDAAIEQCKQELRAKGSGKPTGLAAGAVADNVTAKEVDAHKDAVNKKWLGIRAPLEEE